jgi:hypothetical protein
MASSENNMERMRAEVKKRIEDSQNILKNNEKAFCDYMRANFNHHVGMEKHFQQIGDPKSAEYHSIMKGIYKSILENYPNYEKFTSGF